MGGWGFDGDAGGTSNAGPTVSSTPISADPPSPVGNKRGRHFDGDDDAVPTIPDLEEEAEEDITQQVAAPPVSNAFAVQPVRSVRELDSVLNTRATQLPASP